MNRLFFLLSSFILLGCVSSKPVTSSHWKKCEKVCETRKGVKEACVETFKGRGCHCEDDKIIWLDHKKSSQRQGY